MDALIKDVIGAGYEVANTLGCGFLEKVYERALTRELTARGHAVRQQVTYSVLYKGACVGDYFADLVVDDGLVVEIKCADGLANPHLAQCLNYLKASGLRFGLILNFGRARMQWKRVVNGY